MCKAMASEGTGSTVGKGLVDEQAAGSAVSAALTAADPQVSISLPGSGPTSPKTISGHHLLQQLPSTSSLPAAGIMAGDSLQGDSLQSLVPTSTFSALSVLPSIPQGSRQNTELLLQPSSAGSGLAGQTTTTGLLEAMQHLHLQMGAGPSSTQQMSAPVYAAQATSAPSVGSIGPSTALQDSGDLMRLMGQAQQDQQQQLELSQEQAEDGQATVSAIALLGCVCMGTQSPLVCVWAHSLKWVCC
jgi:hypothetical protein